MQSDRGILQRGCVHPLHVLLDGVTAERHRAVHLCQDLGSGAPAKVSAEAGRNLEDHGDVIRLESLERVVGGPIDAKPYSRYLREKLGTLAAA